VAVNIGAAGQVRGSIGGGIGIGAAQPSTPAFWSFVLLAAMILVIFAVASSLR
jgi:hypothetical protein